MNGCKIGNDLLKPALLLVALNNEQNKSNQYIDSIFGVSFTSKIINSILSVILQCGGKIVAYI